MTKKHRRQVKERNEQRSLPPFRVQPHHFGFRPELDLDKMNQLADELEAEEAAKKLGSLSFLILTPTSP